MITLKSMTSDKPASESSSPTPQQPSVQDTETTSSSANKESQPSCDMYYFFIWLYLWFCPVHYNLVTPQLNTSRHQLSSYHCCCPMALVLDEGKASVLILVLSWWVHNHINHSFCHFTDFYNVLFFLCPLGNTSDKQMADSVLFLSQNCLIVWCSL